VQAPGANVITDFTMVIYCHSTVLLLFGVIKQYYCGNYHRVTVNYLGKKFANIGLGGKLKYRGNLLCCSNLPWYVNPGKCKHCGIFITLAQGVDVI
jgi:hypothetical protein